MILEKKKKVDIYGLCVCMCVLLISLFPYSFELEVSIGSERGFPIQLRSEFVEMENDLLRCPRR